MQLEIITAEPKKTRRLIPILFVHGAWHAAWCWHENFMPYFAEKGYMCYALSLRGHGKSENDKSLRWTSGADYVEDVHRVVEYLQNIVPAKPILVGHSMGGYVVQKYLEKYDAAAAVLLASIPVMGTLPFFLRMFRSHPLPMLKLVTLLRPKSLVEKPELAKAHFFSPDLPDDKFNRYFHQLHDESYRVALDTMLFSRPNPAKVNERKIPMLVLGGDNDAVFPVHEIKATARAYNTEAVIFENMAHDIMLEPRWQTAAEYMLTWLVENNL